jgi:broad specificity phosphatase PhoE
VGVVLEDRRNVVKVYFPEIDRAFWLEREYVTGVAEGRLPTAPLAERLHRICRRVEAVAVEIYDREGEADVFHVFTRGTTLEALVEVRESLGADFRRLDLEPGGVRRARLTLVFRTA